MEELREALRAVNAIRGQSEELERAVVAVVEAVKAARKAETERCAKRLEEAADEVKRTSSGPGYSATYLESLLRNHADGFRGRP